jgi:competence protein CoiA
MPLTALDAAGDVIDGTQVASAAWAVVHKVRPRPTLLCRACGSPMHAKVSSTGLRFFAHDAVRPDCPATGESAEHRWLKSRLAQAIRDHGWTAVVEAEPAAGDHGGWRADVLALSPDGSGRLALEAQLAPMTTAEGRERTDRYAADGIATWWFTLRNAPWLWTLPGGKVARDDDAPAEDDGLPRLHMTRGCVKYVNGEWVHAGAVPLPKLVGLLLDRRVAAYTLQYLSETLVEGSRERSLYHRAAVSIVAVSHIADEERRRARQAAEYRRLEAEAAKREKNTEALYARQRAVIPGAAEDAAAAAGPNEAVWLGIPPSVARSRADATLENAVGNEKSAMGSVVWLGPARDNLRLFAVVCPVASRITPGLAASWRRRGVQVYVAEPLEQQRVAEALGWPPQRLRLVSLQGRNL